MCLVVSYFWWMKISKEVNFGLSCGVFLYRELRSSWITLYKDCDSILLSCVFLSNQKCFDCKRWFGWLGLCDASRSISLPSQFCLYGMKPCVNLKETLASLKQFEVSDEMSRNVFWDSNNWLIHFILMFVVWISLTVYASVPLHAVYASVPLREQTCHVLEDVMWITFT